MNAPQSPIVICFDGSAGAAGAVDAAARLFPGSPAIVLYAWSGIDSERIQTTSVEIVREELIEEVRVAARREAAAVAEEGASLARRDGLDATPLLVESRDGVARTIARVATKESAAAVVVGRRSRTGLGSLLPGSVSRGVVDECTMPVVVA